MLSRMGKSRRKQGQEGQEQQHKQQQEGNDTGWFHHQQEQSNSNYVGHDVASSLQGHHQQPLIYSAPTVDTLGDESTLYRPFATPRVDHQPPQSNSNNTNQQTSTLGGSSSTHQTPMRPTTQSTSTSPVPSISSKLKSSTKQRDHVFRTMNKTSRKKGNIANNNNNNEFQIEEDAISVKVRTIPVAERSAFALRPLIMPKSQHNNNNSSNKKISPSWQHFQLLQKLQSITHVRQLAFSPLLDSSSSSSATVPTGRKLSSRKRGDNATNNNSSNRQYHSIDPVQATISSLPSTPPLLSNKKHRLPRRADVGFPNASMEEIQAKQREIQQETEWEEASPRLIVLVTSDDLGTAVVTQEDGFEVSNPNGSTTSSRSSSYGILGIPWAGPELIQAKERNKSHNKNHDSNNNDVKSDKQSSTTTTTTKTSTIYTRSRTNMLAPPLDSTFSSSMGWRPRPFHDRPPGMKYTLVCPLSIDFQVGSIEPLVCSLTLYTLRDPANTNTAAIIADGKASEEFWFPAGEWSGKIRNNVATVNSNDTEDSNKAGNDNNDSSWNHHHHQRKQKAIFAHDPLLLDNYQDLFIVLQVYKVTHVDLAAAYIAGKNPNYNTTTTTTATATDRKSIHQRLKKLKHFKGGNNNKKEAEDFSLLTTYRSSAVFDSFGTKFLSPLCFGINPLFPGDAHAGTAGLANNSSNNTTNFELPADLSWPNGNIQQNMQLFAFPSHSESQEDFTERLRMVAGRTITAANNGLHHHNQQNAALGSSNFPIPVDEGGQISSSLREERSTISATTSTGELSSSMSLQSESAETFSSPNKKKGVRRFMMQRINSKKTEQQQSSSSTSATSTTTAAAATTVGGIIEETPMIPATVTLFVSALDVDFLQSMLTTPLELAERRGQEKDIPNLLVDVSGESAIMVDPKKEGQKRSSLVRLPPRPGDYLGSSDFREVLFLPPRPRKSYDVDATPSYRSLLNLLYLYPKLLVLKQESSSSSSTKKKNKQQQLPRYTIRIRLVQNVTETAADDDVIKTSSKAVEAFHNPAPWVGLAFIKSVYTRIPADGQDDHHKSGIPLKDEFKLKLPMVLESGSHYLHFSLFAVDFEDDFVDDTTTSGEFTTNEEGCGLSVQSIADVMIPLSSSLRDPSSGVKATTIIPNGCHRLKLGDYQFHIETRLVSSIHVSDPAVASALRDFPSANDESSLHQFEGRQLTEHALVVPRTLSRQTSSDSAVPEQVVYSTLFSSASGSALTSHFRPLLVMHLSNLINMGKGVDTNEMFLVGNVQSFLGLCRQVKDNFLISCAHGEQRWNVFVKAVIDSFDEASLRSVSLENDAEEDASSEVLPSRSNTISNSTEEEGAEDEFDGGAIRRRKKDSIRSGIDLRISRTFSAMESSEIPFTPFSRVAFGATKTDRMRLKAELENDTSRFSHLVDDDETVATFATGFASGEATMAEAREIFGNNNLISSKSFSAEALESSFTMATKDDQTPAAAGSSSNNMDFSSYQRTLSEIGLGLPKRVRSAAQTIIAPCVTPNLSAVFSASPRNVKSSSSKTRSETTAKKPEYVAKQVENDTPKKHNRGQEAKLYSPGSDVEDSEGNCTEEFEALSQMGALHHTAIGVFRAPWNCPTLIFSIPDGSGACGFSLGRGDFLYETIMVVWLQAWMDHIDGKGTSFDTRQTSQIAIPPFADNMQNDPLYAFQYQLDVLLPICLKSIVLRYGEVVRSPHSPTARVVADERHTAVLEPFIEMLALSLMGQGMKGLGTHDKDVSLAEALAAAEHVLDFLVGLCTVFHPAHISMLIQKFFLTLRNCEAIHIISSDEEVSFEWTEETLHRVKCSRQLRLRAAEKLAALPNFVALNYPARFHKAGMAGRPKKPKWTTQYYESPNEKMDGQGEHSHDGLVPRTGWLAELLSRECLSICALSCDAVVAEAMAHIESHEDVSNPSDDKKSLKKRATASLKREDLLMLQSIAIHAITCVHELLLRRHAMDRRFQKESSRGRIAALYAKPLFEKSLASVRWLARMESTHKVRSLWLLCFVYILQEAPEGLLREAVRSYSNPEDGRIHRFIRLLRLGSSTFQSFIDQQRHCMFPLEIDIGLSPWLLQESFNTICATIIVVVEECASPTSTFPREQQKMIQGILDLLLHVLTMPQSSVTHLRAVGGAIQALENFGPAMFLDIAGNTLQHWIRVILGLMNSISLSVRSISVDFVISLFGNVFDMLGNIDELAMIFASVLPEVVAREAALCSVSGFISNLEDVEKSVWPIRRSFADIEDANPLDDDRVDPQLSPVLNVFCRACQAIIDGVLIEMRLQGANCVVVGSRMPREPQGKYTFDADEESLYEAANFFGPETAPMQRIRWLMTLRSLHKAKGQWIEAAESLMMCARTISDSIPHLRNVWRPSRFALWSDARRSLWLSTVGEEIGNPEVGNEQVMTFADAFLEPRVLGDTNEASTKSSKLSQPTIFLMCLLLTNITKEAVALYEREEGLDGLAYSRLESLLKILMGVLDQHAANNTLDRNKKRSVGSAGRKRYVEEEACLRRVLAGISGDMTKLAERMLLIAEDLPPTPKAVEAQNPKPAKGEGVLFFVRVLLSGKKPSRFLESTTLPTFLEWGSPCICRVPKSIVASVLSSSSTRLEERMCSAFGKSLRDALLRDGESIAITCRTGSQAAGANNETRDDEIYVDINFVQMNIAGEEDQSFGFESKHFFYRKATSITNSEVHGLPDSTLTAFVEMTVANPFPCPLSRQKSLLISEFMSNR